MKLAILWSGGCDSTVILHYLLNDKDLSEKYEIRTFSYDINKISDLKSRDKQAREKLLKEFNNRKLPIFKHIEREISQEDPIAHVHEQKGGYAQQAVWACVSPIHLYPDEDLCIGYISGDAAVSGQVLIDAFYAGQKTMGHTGILQYPLAKYNKEEILNYLIKHNLRSLVNTCCWTFDHNNDNKNYYELFPAPCWSCASCKKILQANLMLEKFPQDLRDIEIEITERE